MKKLFTLLLLTTASLDESHAQCSFSVSTSVSNIACHGTTTGAITVNVTGGTAPFSYQLSGGGAGAWVSSNVFNALGAAVYPVSVRDASGCIKTVFATVTQPTAITITPTVTPVSCSGASNGAISVNVSGGTPSYSYNWTRNNVSYATTQNISGLNAGNYKLVVTDAAGCQSTMPGSAQPVQVSVATGFNQDVVANGATTATASTSVAFDDGGAVFFEDQFLSSGNTPGVPASRQFANPAVPDRIYNLANYTGNNALQIAQGAGGSYTLGFDAQHQIAYSNLYVAASCGNGNMVLNYSVNFSDATTQTGTFNAADWFFSTGATGHAMAAVKRITRDVNQTVSTQTFTLWEQSIPINVSNQGKTVTGITFSYNSGGNTQTRANIMAIAGTSSPTGGIVPLADGPQAGGTPSVSIASDMPGNQFCNGQNVTFTAVPTNGGSTPGYQWYVNGSAVSGATSATYTRSASSSYNVHVVMTAAGTGTSCLSTNTATSSTTNMTMNAPAASVAVTAASGASTCTGAAATFTANPTNGGSAPTYQWRVNNVDVSGATSPTYTTSTLNNNDQVSVRMTSSFTCATNNPATSSNVQVTVANYVTPAATIGYTRSGSNVNFTSTVTNAGSSPSYQWYKNNAAISGANSSTYTAVAPASSDYFFLAIAPSAGCYTEPAAVSNYVTGSIALPLTWVYFDAKPLGSQVSLQWGTATEKGVRQFLIERSADARDWATIGITPAMGNDKTNFNYSFADAQPLKGMSYYRIRQEDHSGAATYTDVKKVMMGDAAADLSVSVFPNPFSRNASLMVTSPKAGQGTIHVRDMSGRLVGSAMVAFRLGTQTIAFPMLAELKAGMYQLLAMIDGQRVTVPIARID